MSISNFHLLLSAITGSGVDLQRWIESWKVRVKETDKKKEQDREIKIRGKGVVPSQTGLLLFSFLPSNSLAMISLVNKNLRQVVSHDIVWRPRCVAKWSELELATRVEDDPFPAWKSCFTRRIGVKETELKDIMQDRELGRCDWYTCSKGHLYMIGECRLPMFMAKCPTCGERIGGRHHTMESSNKRIGAVYKEGLMNKKVSVDDVQAVVAGAPASKFGHEDEKHKKRKDNHSERTEKAMKEVTRWLALGSRSDSSILMQLERKSDLDTLAKFRILLSFFGQTTSHETVKNLSKEIIERSEGVFQPLAKFPGDQRVLVGALEEFCAKTSTTVALFDVIVRAFHRSGVLSSTILKEWLSSSTESSWLIHKSVAIQLRTQLKTFITPLC